MKIYYVNKDFIDFTGFKEEDVLLSDVQNIFYGNMADFVKDIIVEHLNAEEPSYFIIRGKTNYDYCYWGLVKITPFQSKLNNELRYLIEIKMLPVNAIEKVEKVFDTVEKVYESAGKDFAKKYFEGFLEERGQTFEEFVIDLLGVKKKKIDKYFNM
jgi:hypothetical protein